MESDLDAHGNAFSVTDQLVVAYFYQYMDEDTVIRFLTVYGTMVHAVQGVYPPSCFQLFTRFLLSEVSP